MGNYAEQNFERALACFKNKEVEKAEELCTLVLKKNPRHGNTLNLRGVIFWKQGNPRKACELIQEAMSALPEKAPHFACNLALIHTQMGEIETAAHIYQKAAEDFYESGEFDEWLTCLFSGAYLLRDNQLLEKSKSFYQLILQKNPFQVHACNDYGLLLMQEQNFEGAKAYFQKALSNEPSYINSYLNLGTIFQLEKKIKEAATLYEKCLEIDPDCFEAHLNLSSVCREEGKIEEGLKYAKKAETLFPNHPGLCNNLGILYALQEKDENAIAYFKKALELDPGYADAKKNLERLL